MTNPYSVDYSRLFGKNFLFCGFQSCAKIALFTGILAHWHTKSCAFWVFIDFGHKKISDFSSQFFFKFFIFFQNCGYYNLSEYLKFVIMKPGLYCFYWFRIITFKKSKILSKAELEKVHEQSMGKNTFMSAMVRKVRIHVRRSEFDKF